MRITLGLMLVILVAGVGCSRPHAGIEHAGGEIHWMAAKGDINGLRKRLENGADINTRDPGTNFTPLHYAAWTGEYKTALFLVERGAKINAKTLYKNTPLHYAAGAENRCYDRRKLSEGHLQIVELLINRGAPVDPRNGEGITPLQVAAGCDALEIARLLIAQGANVDNRSHQYSVLETAAFWSRDIAFLLIQNGAKVDIFDRYSGVSPLTIAIENKDMGLMEAILQRGADLNRRPTAFRATPLGLAVDSAPDRFVERLLEAGADPNLETGFRSRLNMPPLVIAVRNSDASSLGLLIEHGAKIPAIDPETGDPLLHYAVDHNAVEVVRVLLENHVNVNTAKDDGMTALHRAALEDNPELVELLLKHGADPHAISQGRKPREMAWDPETIAIFDRFQRAK